MIADRVAREVNIAAFPAASGPPHLVAHVFICCECRRSIRSAFYQCVQICVHHDPNEQSGCGWAKHQYRVCITCYSTCTHAKQHLKKVRPYDPLAVEDVNAVSRSEQIKLKNDVKRLQQDQDLMDDKTDGKASLSAASHVVPAFLKNQVFPFGNVHASVTFGPLVMEIGARQ